LRGGQVVLRDEVFDCLGNLVLIKVAIIICLEVSEVEEFCGEFRLGQPRGG